MTMYNMMLSTASESVLRTKACKEGLKYNTSAKINFSKLNLISNPPIRLFPPQSVWLDQYRRHNAAVKALVPPSNLLVYKVGEGWERLCQFLELEVPSVPFPHENKADWSTRIQRSCRRFSYLMS